MIRRPPRPTQSGSSAASDVYKRQHPGPVPRSSQPRRDRSSRSGRVARAGRWSQGSKRWPCCDGQVAGRLNGVIVDCAIYVEGKRWEGHLSLDAAVSAAYDQEGFVWVEDSVFAANRCNHAERIYRLKREALEFKRAVLPLALAEPVHRLVNVPVQCVAAGLQEYFRDVHDHLLLSLIHISEPTRLGMISYAVFC